MLLFLSENLGTLVVGLVLVGIVTAIVMQLIRNRRKGKCISCDCCGGCSGSSSCSAKQ